MHILKFLATALFLVASVSLAQPVVDGVIGEGEYVNTRTEEASGAVMSWTIEGDTLYFAATIASRGWAGFGFASAITDRKQGFDQYIATMDGDTPVLLDMYQAATRNAPELDEDEGGTNSILAFAGVHADDVWVIEFSRLLDTGEETDVAIVPGTPMIISGATAPAMDIARRHDRSSQGGAFVLDDFVF